MKKICIITNKYPNPIENNVLVFVQHFVWAMADQGVECSVICPMPVNLNLKYVRFPNKIVEKTENGSIVDIYFPKYIGFGQSYILGYNPARLTTYNFTRAACRAIDSMKDKPDAVYGHFVTPAGIAATKIGRAFNIPSFMAYGEATLMTIDHVGADQVSKELSTLAGVVAVSSKNKEMLISVNVVREDVIEVFPNGYCKERFYPRSKAESRERFKLPQDKFIVCFVGSFDRRKGIKRLMKAVNGMDDIYMICAGEGKLRPRGEKCLYNNIVRNEELPWFYSAADIFVLPTLNEGCCNAIIEAMACGLPIISSDLPFNDDILDENCSIRVDPLNIDEIKAAIKTLYDDRGRLQVLHLGSLKKAKSLTLETRAKRIIEFIDRKLLSYSKIKM